MEPFWGWGKKPSTLDLALLKEC
ncbi:rCG46241 [Rattus norvegicus]|uniref:RCG46241 n=1 Tax=Rattus norvegicus TaxID=10116 RepID=A6IDN8_RAT|nr:rCG46241 [Rattus norvegicus]